VKTLSASALDAVCGGEWKPIEQVRFRCPSRLPFKRGTGPASGELTRTCVLPSGERIVEGVTGANAQGDLTRGFSEPYRGQ
jgi:hypothetical protein